MGFQLDSQKIDGSLSVFNIGAKASTEGKVLRDVEKELKTYGLKQRTLCEQWNSCAITKEKYFEATERNQKVIDGVKVAAEDYKNGASADNDRKQADALAKTVSYVLPEEQLDLEFSAFVILPQKESSVPAKPCPTENRYALREQPTVIAAEDAVPSGSHMYFRVQTNKPAYIYLYQKFDETGELRVLFPHDQIPVKNPIAPNRVATIPPTDVGDFCLDEKNIGLERVFVVASLKPLANLDAAVDKVEKGQYTQVPELKQMDQVAAKSAPPVSSCKTRALNFESKSPSCTRSRGLTFESKASKPDAPVSFKAKSEVGDDVIVKVFPFKHLAPAAPVPPPEGPRSRDIMIEQ